MTGITRSLAVAALVGVLSACGGGSGSGEPDIPDMPDVPDIPGDSDAPGKGNSLPIRVNAGGGAYVDASGNRWIADSGFNTGSVAFIDTSVDGTRDELLYQTHRYDESALPELTYAFDVPDGAYRVNLHFAETGAWFWETGRRVFGILIEGQSVEDSLDIYEAAGAHSALVKSYAVTVNDGRLQIDFIRQVQNPAVSAIEIMELESTAIRVNAGGGHRVDKSGNEWLADTGFNTGATATVNSAIEGTDDDFLYQNQRYDETAAPELAYAFDVPNGEYQVNLHFAETGPWFWERGRRVFGVQIEGQMVENGLDIYAAAGANTALVKSYTTNVRDGRLQIDFVHQVQNPTISAIEVLGPVVTHGAESEVVQDGTSKTVDVLADHPGLGELPVTVTLASQPENGTASVQPDNTIVYVADEGFAGIDSLIYWITNSDGEKVLASVSIQVECKTCPAERVLTLSWNPNPDTVTGYQVFRGPTAEAATLLLDNLPLNSGLVDPTAPRVQYRSRTDLGLNVGEQACFRVKAYNNEAFSDHSQAVCGVI